MVGTGRRPFHPSWVADQGVPYKIHAHARMCTLRHVSLGVWRACIKFSKFYMQFTADVRNAQRKRFNKYRAHDCTYRMSLNSTSIPAHPFWVGDRGLAYTVVNMTMPTHENEYAPRLASGRTTSMFDLEQLLNNVRAEKSRGTGHQHNAPPLRFHNAERRSFGLWLQSRNIPQLGVQVMTMY